MSCPIHQTTPGELCACGVRWAPDPLLTEEIDFNFVFAEAEQLDNPLAVPLVAALQGVRHVKTQLHEARVEAAAERTLRRQAVHELARVTAQLDTARRTIAAQRAEARR